MMVSTRGRYALRVMLDLAQQEPGVFIPLRDVAGRLGVSLNYLAQIVPLLSKGGLIESLHGKGGGCRLRRAPEECFVGEILRLTDESLAPVSCLEKGAAPCGQADACLTLPMWKKANDLLNGYFDSVSLTDILKSRIS